MGALREWRGRDVGGQCRKRLLIIIFALGSEEWKFAESLTNWERWRKTRSPLRFPLHYPDFNPQHRLP